MGEGTEDMEEEELDSQSRPTSTSTAASGAGTATEDEDDNSASQPNTYRTVKGIARPVSADTTSSTGILTPEPQGTPNTSTGHLRSALESLKLESGLSPSPVISRSEETPRKSTNLKDSIPPASPSFPGAPSFPPPSREAINVNSTTVQQSPTTLPPTTATPLTTRNMFKAARLCRLTRRINCADFSGEVLLLGADDGLHALEMESNQLGNSGVG